MAAVLIKAHVAYPGDFIRSVTAQVLIFENGGSSSMRSCVDVGNQNIVYIWIDWESTESANRFWKSDQGNAVKAAWNTVSTPEVIVLRGQED
jgi:hypothetical protein